jgi:recombination protein RecT
VNDTPTTQALAPIVAFKRDLARLKDAGELDMLPANVSFDAFKNAAIVALTDNPAIFGCNRDSLFRSIRRLAAAGLVPDGREAAIVPFKGQAQAMPMVYGLIKVARNSGEIASIWAEVVMGDETFDISMVDGERKFEHRYDPMNRSGEVKGAYAVAKLKDGTVEIEAMGRDQIEKRRKASANQRDDKPTGIWQQWYDEMAKKTVIRALVKRLPMSSEDMRRVMVEDDEPVSRDITPEGPRPNLAQRLAQPAAAPNSPPESDVTLDGEIVAPDEEGPATEPDEDLAGYGIPGSQAWEAGMAAFRSGQKLKSIPYDQGTQDAADWLGGYVGARKAAQ